MAVIAVHRRAVALDSSLLGGNQRSARPDVAESSFGPAQLALILLVSGNKKRVGIAHHMRAQAACEAQQAAGRLSSA